MVDADAQLNSHGMNQTSRWVTALAEFITFFLICVWVFSYLGGVGFSAKEVPL